MKKLIVSVSVLLFVVLLVGCNGIKPNTEDTTPTPSEKNETTIEETTGASVDVDKEVMALAEVDQYTQEELNAELVGASREELHAVWGEHEGILSGFWGEIWPLDNGTEKSIIVYYNTDGMVMEVKVMKLP